jgi:predicted acetyltransferase
MPVAASVLICTRALNNMGCVGVLGNDNAGFLYLLYNQALTDWPPDHNLLIIFVFNKYTSLTLSRTAINKHWWSLISSFFKDAKEIDWGEHNQTNINWKEGKQRTRNQ